MSTDETKPGRDTRRTGGRRKELPTRSHVRAVQGRFPPVHRLQSIASEAMKKTRPTFYPQTQAQTLASSSQGLTLDSRSHRQISDRPNYRPLLPFPSFLGSLSFATTRISPIDSSPRPSSFNRYSRSWSPPVRVITLPSPSFIPVRPASHRFMQHTHHTDTADPAHARPRAAELLWGALERARSCPSPARQPTAPHIPKPVESSPAASLGIDHHKNPGNPPWPPALLRHRYAMPCDGDAWVSRQEEQ